MMNDLKAAVSLEEWVAKVGTWKTATRELVRLWLVNELGCQRELANHLGLSDRAIRKHVAKLREDGELPQVAETDGRKQPLKKEPSSYSVEQRSAPEGSPEGSPAPIADYPAAVLPTQEPDDAPLTLPTAEELMTRVLNLEAENASLRALLEAQPAVEATVSEELTEALAKVKELEAKVDSLFKENEELCDELAEQDEEVERLQGVVTANRVWIDKREQMLKDQHGSTPMEKRWKALIHRVENEYPAPVPSTRTIKDAPAIMDAIAKEANEKGFGGGDGTLTTERYVRGQALIKWWNTQTQTDAEGKSTGWVHFSGDDTLEFLTLLDDFWPVEAEGTATETIDA